MSIKMRISAFALAAAMLIIAVCTSAFAVSPYFDPPTGGELTEQNVEIEHNAVPSYKYGQADIEGYVVDSVREEEDSDGVKYLEFLNGGRIQVSNIPGYSVAEMADNELSYSFSLRKKPDAPILTADYIALESNNPDGSWGRVDFFDIDKSGNVVHDGRVIDTVTEDKITTVNLVINFADCKIDYYSEDGIKIHSFDFTVPENSGAADGIEWKNLITKYFLWFKTDAVTGGALLIYGITVTEGNVFEVGKSAAAGAARPTPSGSAGEPGSSVSFNANGGTMPENTPESYDSKTGLVLPVPEAPSVSKKSYVFGGWYTSKTFEKGTRIDEIPAGATTSYELYAKWNLVLADADIASAKKTSSAQTLGNVTYKLWASAVPGTDEFGDYIDLTSDYDNNAIINVARDDISGLGAMKTNVVSYQLKFRKPKASSSVWTCNYASFEATASSVPYYLFKIKSDGTVVAMQNEKLVIATITADEVAEINFVLDFDTAAITYYDKAGKIIASFDMISPGGKVSDDPLVWKTEVTKYVLYMNMGGSEGTLRNYGITVQEGNMFDISDEYPQKECGIAYETNGGTLPQGIPEVYDPAQETMLAVPEKENAVFLGWYTTPSFDKGTLVDRIAEGSSGVCTLYARWRHTYVNASAEVIAENEAGSTFKDIGGMTFNTAVTVKTENKIIYTVLPKGLINKSTGTYSGDEFELTSREIFDERLYLTELPESALAITDENGNITAYTLTAGESNTDAIKCKTASGELSYFADLGDGNTELTTGSYTLQFSLRAGAGMNFDCDIVNVKYQTDGREEILEKPLLGVIMKSGIPYIHMAEHSSDDDFILRADVSTEISVRFWIERNEKTQLDELNFRISVNNTYHSAGAEYGGEEVSSYRILGIGAAFDGSAVWDEPLMTVGRVKAQSGDGYETDTASFTGFELGSDAVVYRYEANAPKEIITGDDIVNIAGFVKLEGYSTTLGANLGMNFYAKIPAEVKKAVITTAGATKTINISELSADIYGRYKFTVELSSIQTREDVNIRFFSEADTEIAVIAGNSGYKTGGCTASVYEYAQQLTADGSQSEAVRNVAKALIDYAAYAENYFDKDGGFDITSAFPNADTRTVESLDPDSVKGTVSGASQKLGEVRLILDSATKIRINLSAAALVESDNANVKYIAEGNKFYIDICDIDAKNLKTVYTFTVDGKEVKINVLGVAAAVVANAELYGDDFVNLMKALYLYSKACDELA